MSRPLVSVILPTRNRNHLVGGAIASVLDQTFENFELWVGDDASDPPVEARELPDDARLHLHRADHHVGYAMRARLLERTKGELVAFLDDDDAWFPTALGVRVEALARAPDDVAGAECGYEMWDGDRLEFVHVPRTDRDNARALLAHPVFVPSTTVLRRSALDTVGGFPPGRTGDWALWLRLSRRFGFVSLPEVLVRRRRHTLPPAEELDGYTLALAEIESFLEELSPRDRRRVRAVHCLGLGVLHARLGDRARARRSLIEAWLLDPPTLRPLVHLLRTVVGEEVWRAMTEHRRRLYRAPPTHVW